MTTLIISNNILNILIKHLAVNAQNYNKSTDKPQNKKDYIDKLIIIIAIILKSRESGKDISEDDKKKIRKYMRRIRKKLKSEDPEEDDDKEDETIINKLNNSEIGEDFLEISESSDIQKLIKILEKVKEIVRLKNEIDSGCKAVKVDKDDLTVKGISVIKAIVDRADSKIEEANQAIKTKINTEKPKISNEETSKTNIDALFSEIEYIKKSITSDELAQKYLNKFTILASENKIDAEQIIFNKNQTINKASTDAITDAEIEAKRLFDAREAKKNEDDAKKKAKEAEIAIIIDAITEAIQKAKEQIEIIKKNTDEIKAVKIKDDITITELESIKLNINLIFKNGDESRIKTVNFIEKAKFEASKDDDIKIQKTPEIENVNRELETAFDALKKIFNNTKILIDQKIESIEKTRVLKESEQRAIAEAETLKTALNKTYTDNLSNLQKIDSTLHTELKGLYDTLINPSNTSSDKDKKLQSLKGIITSKGALKYKTHPYPEVIENIYGLTNYSNLIGGNFTFDEVKNLINLPSKWLKEHQEMYRDPFLLKLLSLKPDTIKNLSLFKTSGENRISEENRKLLILILFWDAQDLIDEIGKSAMLDGKYKYLILNKRQEINDTIKKLQTFEVPVGDPTKLYKGNTAEFVLTENLIRYYKYILNVSSFKPEMVYLYSLLIQDYMHWKQTVTNFKELKKRINETGFIKLINDNYILINKEPIITYLKIRCDDKSNNQYNEYFNIYTERLSDRLNKLQSIYITGPDPNLNMSLYKNTGPKANLPSMTFNSDGTLKEILKYDYGYLYGPFTRVFLPNEDNETVSKNCNEILSSITEKNKSVFIIGYGQSGAGKTSSLISRKYKNARGKEENEDGIIFEILKNLDVDEITVTVKELFSKNPDGNSYNPDEISYDNIIFKKDTNGEFIIKNDTTNPKENKKEILQKIKFINGTKVEWKNTEINWKIYGEKFYHSRYTIKPNNNSIGKITDQSQATQHFKPINKLSDFIKVLINDVRMVSPTPNNRQSSRSHVLFFFKLKYTGHDPVFLILGDLAGAENKFICDEPQTKKEFLNLRLPLETESDPPYYVSNKFEEIIPKDEYEKKILNYYEYKNIEEVANYNTGYEGYNKDIKEKLDIFIKMYSYFTAYNEKIENEINETTKRNPSYKLNDAKKDTFIKINIIYEKCKNILKKKILQKNNSLNNLVDQKLKIDHEFNENKYSKEVITNIKTCDLSKRESCESNFPVQGNIERIKTSSRFFKYTNSKIINNRIKYYIDIINYLNFKDEKSFDKLFLISGETHGTANINTKFTEDKENKKYMPYVLGSTSPDLNTNYLNSINKYSNKNYNNKKLFGYTDEKGVKIQGDIEKVDHLFDDIKTIINEQPSTLDFKIINIYQILNDDNDTFLNNLSLTDLNFYYEYFLKEKIEFEKSEINKIYSLIKYIILIPLIKLEILDYNDNILTMIDDIKNTNFKSKLGKLNNANTLIFSTIESNIKVYYKEIQDRCIDRDAEGQFINRSLYGMRQDLIEIAKNNNREGLFQKIPIFNSPCLEYYCNSQSYDCFEYAKTQNTPNIETKIFDTISNVLNTRDDGTIQKDNRSIINNLSIVIFGLLNISRDTNDPPKMPYIDLTILKNIRDKLNTNFKFENNESLITSKIEEIKLEKVKILSIMQNYRLSISVTLLNKIEEHSKEIDIGNISNIHIKLNNFIQTLEEINSTTLLGTLDFLNYMKNSLQADNTCDISKLPKNKFTDAINGDLLEYKNIITSKSLKGDIDQQEKQLKLSKTGGSLYKQSLIKEYKQLLKKLNQS
jgi:hypothetical protein